MRSEILVWIAVFKNVPYPCGIGMVLELWVAVLLFGLCVDVDDDVSADVLIIILTAVIVGVNIVGLLDIEVSVVTSALIGSELVA